MRYEYVKSMRLAGLLMQQGFKIYAVQKDKFNPAYDVYLFRKCDELSSAIVKYSENGGKNGITNKNCKDET